MQQALHIASHGTLAADRSRPVISPTSTSHTFSPRPQTLCRSHLTLPHQRPGCQQRLAVGTHARSKHTLCKAAQPEASVDQDDLVGEDAAYFDVEKQTTKSWTLFTGLLVGVLGLIYVVGPACNLLTPLATSQLYDLLQQCLADMDRSRYWPCQQLPGLSQDHLHQP